MYHSHKCVKVPVYDDYLISSSNLLTTEAVTETEEYRTHRKRNSCIQIDEKGKSSNKKITKLNTEIGYSSKRKMYKSLAGKHDSKTRNSEKKNMHVP